jgi:hypothetical protein
MSAFDSALIDVPPQQLETFVREVGSNMGIDFLSLDAGTVVNVHTKYSTYRLVVSNPEERLARITGGRLFMEPTDVRLEGATAGGTAIKPGWIGVGLRIELRNQSNRVTTSVVQSLTIEPPPQSLVC